MGSEPEHSTQRYLQRANTHSSGVLNYPEHHHGQCHMVLSELNNIASEESDCFDFLQNTLLPGMKLGWNLVTGKERHLMSWKSDDDPAFGDFSYGIDIHGYPQAIITKGRKVEYRGGPWNGVRFTGTPKMSSNTFYTFTFGFEPISGHRSQGCRHTIPLNCNSGEGFNKYTNLKLPDSRESWYNDTMTGVECENMCKRNCSCTAYAHLNISGTGNGCLLWSGNLTDIRTFVDNGDTLYIRFSASELGVPENDEGRSDDEDLELPLFGLSTILQATNNFSINNKLGEGGYGPVYKWLHGSRAWRLHNEGRSLQLVAECLVESIDTSQVQRAIHVGLLCVQRHPEDRPTMTSVIMMLGSESPLPVPKEPGYYVEKTKQDTAQSSSSYATSSNYNEQNFSISMLLGR
ncbi:hypothetical protein L1987_85055 [Smallanthus sonchifolius]|uniref:Uncharacterized protein n=1 Tax=Smallanthus sonchifolius TaxID=185202 RepID=A0ACB8XVG7_9ASTR|nr:hypothetical protein L1987_85055 [Smallanthus sonchifolius]